MKRHLYSYDDPMKKFLKDAICKIPYFGKNYLNKHLFHKILYSFEIKYYSPGDLVLKEDDPTNNIYIVVNGSLEIYNTFEGNEFIIETLKPGSVLNYRVIFSDD